MPADAAEENYVRPVQISGGRLRGSLALREIRIEHRYPEALGFLRRHGSQALAVLHDLLAHAEHRGGQLVAQASTREIADRLEFLSKDTVHRRLRQLGRAGVIEVLARPPGSRFAPTTYLLHLEDSGITVAGDDIPA